MTGTTLATRLSEFGDIDASASQVIGWIDQCQREIATEAGKASRSTITTVVANTEKALPADFAALIGVLIAGVPYTRMDEIIIREDGFIVFPEDITTLTLLYRRIPAAYTALATELEVHPLIHHAILYYLIAMYYDQEGEGDAEESGLAQRYMNRFEYLKQKAIDRINNIDASGPTPTTDAMYKRSRYHSSSLSVEDEDGYV